MISDENAEEPSDAASSCATWFVETQERMERALEFNPPPAMQATLPEAIEFSEGYLALAKEQARSKPPAEAVELNELVVAYFEAWSEYWQLWAKQLRDPTNTSLLLQGADAIVLVVELGEDISLTAQLVAAECGLDEREYTLP